MTCRLTFTLLFILVGPVWSQQPATLITDVNIVDVRSGKLVIKQDVLIRDGRIVSILKAGKTKTASPVIILSGQGKFLIPGLVDMHAHFPFQRGSEKLASIPEVHTFLDLHLRHGVTSLLCMGDHESIIELREKIAGQTLQGPRIFASRRINRPKLTADEGTLLAREIKKQGYDFLKVYTDISEPGFNSISAEAKIVGLPIIGHIPRAVGLGKALNGGLSMVAHTEEFLYNEPFNFRFGEGKSSPLTAVGIAEVVGQAKRHGLAVTPTLEAFHMIYEQAYDLNGVLSRPESKLVPENVKSDAQWRAPENRRSKQFATAEAQAELLKAYEMQKTLTLALHQAGIMLLAGTDVGLPGIVPGYSLHSDLERLVEAGLSPLDALRTATLNPAKFLQHEADFGTIEVGATADLVLLSANPLDDIRNTRKIVKVLRQGHVVGSSE
jgi:hypothetical protein